MPYDRGEREYESTRLEKIELGEHPTEVDTKEEFEDMVKEYANSRVLLKTQGDLTRLNVGRLFENVIGDTQKTCSKLVREGVFHSTEECQNEALAYVNEELSDVFDHSAGLIREVGIVE